MDQFHGSLHEALRNQVLDAADFFDDNAGNLVGVAIARADVEVIGL